MNMVIHKILLLVVLFFLLEYLNLYLNVEELNIQRRTRILSYLIFYDKNLNHIKKSKN